MSNSKRCYSSSSSSSDEVQNNEVRDILSSPIEQLVSSSDGSVLDDEDTDSEPSNASVKSNIQNRQSFASEVTCSERTANEDTNLSMSSFSNAYHSDGESVAASNYSQFVDPSFVEDVTNQSFPIHPSFCNSNIDDDSLDSDDSASSLQWHRYSAPDQLYSSDDEGNINDYDVDNPLIYNGAQITVDESMTAILTYIVKHELDGREIVDLLNLINLHCKIEDNNMRTSLYLFKKYFSVLKCPVICHYFCSSCFTEVKKDNLKCPNFRLHPKMSDISYFIEIPLISQLKTLFSQEEFYNNLSYRYTRQKLREENIEDVYDGQLYKELTESGFISEDNPLNFTMIMNSDGVPVFKSSKKSLWPVFFNVLELPLNLRFLKKFTIIGGLWFGSKPIVNIILGKLVPSFREIQKGFDVQPFGSSKTSPARGILLSATSDLPAKAMLLGMMSHSGAKSCHVCKINGESVKIPSKKKKVLKKELKKKKNQQIDEDNTANIDFPTEKEKEKYSTVWVFRYDKNLDLRSHDESRNFGNLSQQLLERGDLKDGHVFGFKHPSALFNIMYDAIRGFGIDDLHTLYLGVIKGHIKLWFDSKNGKEPFSIRKYLEVVDDRLEAIRPPNFLERGIRGISDEFSYWNGNECKTWAHYTSIPVLNGVLPDKYLEHYINLISCLQILLSSSISPEQLLFCQKTLEEYVKKFEILYGTRHMTMVIHMLLHLGFVVTNLGPMKGYSCFPYESLNGEILKMIHGTRYVETQLASGCYLISQLPHKLSSLNSAPVKEYCYKVMHPSLRLKKLEDLGNNQETIFSVGTYKELKTNNHVLSALKNITELNANSTIETYLRLKKGRMLFVCRSYSRCTKTNSFTCSYVTDNNFIQYGAIDIFVKVVTDSESSEPNCKHFAIIEKSVTESLIIGSKTVPHIKGYCLSGLFCAVPVSNIKDMLFLVDIENESYICETSL